MGTTRGGISGFSPIVAARVPGDERQANRWSRAAMPDNTPPPSAPAFDPGTTMAIDRTAMAFSRTAMASDRTLMAVVRTAMAMIGFGFTIFQFFHTLNDRFVDGALPVEAPRRFGLALIVLGVILLSMGILNRRQEARELQARRDNLAQLHLLPERDRPLPGSAMVVAILLLMLGLFAILSVAFRIGPF